MKSLTRKIHESLLKKHIPSTWDNGETSGIFINLKDTINKLIENKILQCGSPKAKFPMPAMKINGFELRFWKNLLDYKAKTKYTSESDYKEQTENFINHKFDIGYDKLYIVLTLGNDTFIDKIKELAKKCDIDDNNIQGERLIITITPTSKEKTFKFINSLVKLL